MKLVIKNLSKSFGKNIAVNDISVELDKGLFGLLGENGAGKSTLIKLIVGLEKADKGEIFFNKEDREDNILNHIGYLPQNPTFYEAFKAYEFIKYMISLKMNKKSQTFVTNEINRVLSEVNLLKYSNKKIFEFSGGMRQRLAIASAMICDPDILILDEPTVGLDLIERINFRNLLVRLSENKIIILATHIVSDVEFVAKEILMIDKGSLINRSSTTDLIEFMNDKTWTIETDAKNISKFTENFLVSKITQNGSKYILKILSNYKPNDKALLSKASLEDYCIYFYGKKNEIRNKKTTI